MHDPSIRKEFAKVLNYEKKKEFGPIINASLNQDSIILKLLDKKYQKYIEMFYDEKYDVMMEQTPNIITGAIDNYHPREMTEITDYCGKLDFDSVTGQPARGPKLDIIK